MHLSAERNSPSDEDFPSRIDLREMSDARAWEAEAMAKRPYRRDVIERMAIELRAWSPSVECVLELGSGPGMLAHSLLQALDDIA